jgi:23S rRNA (adenine2030-N6)-methyltransferase
MYSYQHSYHAGNFADVHKHLVLIAILQYLNKKDTSFGVLDLFAGDGIYDLNSKESQKIKEHILGFAKFTNNPDAPKLIADYLKIVEYYRDIYKLNSLYPGSPAIISSYLREKDSANFIENHPQAYSNLKDNFSRNHNGNIHVHKRDGIAAINGLTPLKEKRGLIFIDPSYEVKEDYVTIMDNVYKSYQKFSNGIYAIWYPILVENYYKKILIAAKKFAVGKIMQFEWSPYTVTDVSEGMLGSGIIVINPPWQLDKTLQEAFSYLTKTSFPETKIKLGAGF